MLEIILFNRTYCGHLQELNVGHISCGNGSVFAIQSGKRAC